MTFFKDFFKNHLRDMIIFGLILFALAISLYSVYLSYQEEDSETNILAISAIEEKTTEETNDDAIEEKTVFVDVKGAVKNPGVYEVASDAIINDVITLAGGFSSNAYQNGINLSKKVSDELVIYVYTKTEIKNSTTVTTSTDTCATSSYDICECVEEKASVIETTDSTTSTSTTESNEETQSSTNSLVNINTANLSELMSLSGIGDAKASAIISYREENGLFSSIEDILNVSGIGESLFAQIKDYITI